MIRNFWALFVITCLNVLLSSCQSTIEPSVTLEPIASTTTVETVSTVTPTTALETVSTARPTAAVESVSANLPLEIDWESDWLKNGTCTLPCWQGIYPGQTTITTTMSIFESLNLEYGEPIIVDSGWELDGYNRGGVSWEKEIEDGYAGGEIRVSGYPLQVYEILLQNYYGYTLQDFIDNLGEPSHIIVLAEPCIDQACNVYVVRIIFYEYGVSLHHRSTGLEPFEFSASWTNFNVSIFDNSPLGFSRYLGQGIMVSVDEVAEPWKGLLGFDAYCKGEGCLVR